MAWPQEATLAGVTCALLAFPIFILMRGYSASRNPRMLMAAAAVFMFFITDLILFAVYLGFLPGAEYAEFVELIGDVFTAGLLASAFTLRFGDRDARDD